MFKQWPFQLQKITHRLSVRAGLFALLAVVSSLAAVLLDGYVPDGFVELAGGNAVDNILNVMASSMLIVTTFALSTMMAAYTAATQHTTPRATNLIINDSKSHSAISIFLGAFIYSVVSLIALSTKYYGPRGRVILLLMTVIVLTAVVWVIIRWVEELKNMGSVHETIRRVEGATAKALAYRAERPTFGCMSMDQIPSNAKPVRCRDVGYIQNIDVDSLGKLAEKENIEMYIEKDVGGYVHLQSNLVFIISENGVSTKLEEKIREAFAIGDQRTFLNDPRFGLSVLSGIGIKALSPSLNDPGTAIDVVGSLVRVLIIWENQRATCKMPDTEYRRLFFPEMEINDLYNDAFYGLIKESAKHLEVVKAMQSGLEILANSTSKESKKIALKHLEILNQRSREELTSEVDASLIQATSMIGENQRKAVDKH